MLISFKWTGCVDVLYMKSSEIFSLSSLPELPDVLGFSWCKCRKPCEMRCILPLVGISLQSWNEETLENLPLQGKKQQLFSPFS